MTAIAVDRLSKEYRLGSIGSGTLRDDVNRWWAALRGKPDPLLRLEDDGQRGPSGRPFWALRDVSFELGEGEVLGVIGRNGAGKSTLLKILSRITAPTAGEARIKGRVASLLEVGTGFHPELTGRENVFLNGAILGMRRTEIARKFDEIVAFAEVDAFIDVPVKRYSSGMYLRLAFAVAAHLDVEVIFVDEVLAVGDLSFQRKCLAKMEDVGRAGRTVLFVSHNMPAVTRLCPRTILLDHGHVLRDGPSHEVVGAYLRSDLGTSASREWSLEKAPGNEIVHLHAVRVKDAAGQVSALLDIRQPVAIEMEFQVVRGGHVLVPNLHFFNEEGTCVFVSSEVSGAWAQKPRPVGAYRSTARIPGNLLAEGTLIVGAAISTMDPVRVHVYERDAVAFQLVDSLDGSSARGNYGGHIPGVVRPLLQWESDFTPDTGGRATPPF